MPISCHYACFAANHVIMLKAMPALKLRPNVGIASKPAIWAKIMRLPRPADLSARRPADFGATHAVDDRRSAIRICPLSSLVLVACT